MNLPKPLAPPYDIRDWRRKPFAQRLRMVCLAWAMQGYGTPWPIYVVYLLKVGAYVGGFWLFGALSAGADGAHLASFWLTPAAFQKAVVWSMAFEVLGLGCGSGPLTGRYLPPIGGVLYFVRPGTTKMPLFPGIPVFGGDTRSVLDAFLYVAYLGSLARVLLSSTLEPALFVPPLVLLAILGLTDKTLFLASRAEHYAVVLVCFLFPSDWLPATKLVWLAIWMWAATSKLNLHFPSVVTVMQSNSPLTFGPLRKALYARYPDDLRPSKLAHVMAHAGTAAEYAFPLALAFASGGTPTRVALAVMLLFHLFITSSVPMGVPIEWNVMMVYGAFFLFGENAAVSALSVHSPALLAFLGLACVLMPVLGNVFPAHVSFLCGMRYYAGNWAYSVWLFRGDASKKLDLLTKSAPRVTDQLRRLYDEDTTTALVSKVMAFRAMHLHGRALHQLVPKAVDDIDAYEWLDGELVAGVAIGWNFGDGHLHDLQLLASLQRQCGFEEGELRCIFVEAQPVFGSTMAWTIADAKTGVRETGTVDVRALTALQPWPEQLSATSLQPSAHSQAEEQSADG